MKNSQYLESYLAGNAERGQGKGLTIGSFLSYNLQGKAGNYSGKYAQALKNSCQRVGAILGNSFAGRDAYYPKQS